MVIAQYSGNPGCKEELNSHVPATGAVTINARLVCIPTQQGMGTRAKNVFY
ncbi:MAG: hypothetical protein J7L16_04460 [Deltaproteobacteria bacterium]|nr:hypothetical protein [Deltaproteobacteria bacterium]